VTKIAGKHQKIVDEKGTDPPSEPPE